MAMDRHQKPQRWLRKSYNDNQCFGIIYGLPLFCGFLDNKIFLKRLTLRHEQIHRDNNIVHADVLPD